MIENRYCYLLKLGQYFNTKQHVNYTNTVIRLLSSLKKKKSQFEPDFPDFLFSELYIFILFVFPSVIISMNVLPFLASE
jgi:hypothetical protein